MGIATCPLARDLKQKLVGCMEVGVIGQQKEVRITSSKLFFQWQQVHGSNSLPGGLLKALGFENWEHFLECCDPLLQPLREVDGGNPACEAWWRGTPGQSTDSVSFKVTSKHAKRECKWDIVGYKRAGSKHHSNVEASTEGPLTPCAVRSEIGQTPSVQKGWRVHSQITMAEAAQSKRRTTETTSISLLQVPSGEGSAGRLATAGVLNRGPEDALRRWSNTLPVELPSSTDDHDRRSSAVHGKSDVIEGLPSSE